MNKLFAAVKRAPKRTAGLLMVAAAVIVTPFALQAWGPERPLYTVENAAPHVTFNSITNHQRIGNETNFVRIREVAQGANFRDDVNLKVGQTYEVMVFYHNNAKRELNDKTGADGNPVGLARDVTARVQMPGRLNANETGTITGFVSSSNATPQTVWDNARAKTDSAVALRYVQGSAKIASSNGAVNGAQLSNEFFRGGVKLGYNKLDGNLPGCNEFSGYITYRFVVDQPNFTVEKKVSVDNGKTWVDSAKTTPGSTVQYRVKYQNTGTVQQDNVVLQDQLPKGVNYVAGSSQIAHSKSGGKYVKAADGITSAGGYKIGSYAPKGNAFFKFSAKAPSADALECGTTTLKNKVTAKTENGNKSDDATIVVEKECKEEPKPVKYTCDALAITKLNRTSFRFATGYTLRNATLQSITYVVRDSSSKEVYRGTNDTFNATETGKYSVQSYLNVRVNDRTVVATSESCKKQFEVEKPQEPKKQNVEIVKKVNGVDHAKVAVNEEFTYQLAVKNTGQTTLRNVLVTDNAPEHVQFIRADKGKITDNKWSHVIPELKVGETMKFAIKAKVIKEVSGTIKNTACVDAPQIPGTPDDCDDATVEVPPKDSPVPPEMKVCELKTNTIITIRKDQFNAHLHSTNLDDCKVVPPAPGVPEVPATPDVPGELPTTGLGNSFMALVGLGSLVASISYYVISRRSLV